MEPLGELLRTQHDEVLQSHNLVRDSNATVFNEVRAIGSALIKQNALSYVSEYKGKGEVTPWLDELEKCRVFNDLHDNVMGRLAWQRSSGTVAAFIRRRLDETPAPTWVVLRKSLEKEFGRVVDSLQSFTIFTSVRQGRDEDVASYTERVLTLGKNAYGDKWEKDDTVKAQALAVYLEGLRSREIKSRIFRANVTTLANAIEMAKSDDLCRRRFGGSPYVESTRREEPMQVESQRRSRCFHCGGSHRSAECRRSVHAIRQPTLSQKERDRRERRCFLCHRTGHYAAKCRNNPAN